MLKHLAKVGRGAHGAGELGLLPLCAHSTGWAQLSAPQRWAPCGTRCWCHWSLPNAAFIQHKTRQNSATLRCHNGTSPLRCTARLLSACCALLFPQAQNNTECSSLQKFTDQTLFFCFFFFYEDTGIWKVFGILEGIKVLGIYFF